MGLKSTFSIVAPTGSATWSRQNLTADLVAPCFVELLAENISGMDAVEDISQTGIYDPSFHEISWLWTVDGGVSLFTNPNLRQPNAKKDHNRAKRRNRFPSSSTHRA